MDHAFSTLCEQFESYIEGLRNDADDWYSAMLAEYQSSIPEEIEKFKVGKYEKHGENICGEVTVSSDIAWFWVEAEHNNKYEYFIYIALLSHQWGKYIYSQGNYFEAYDFLVKSIYYIGMIYGVNSYKFFVEYNDNVMTKRKLGAEKGGQRKADRYNSVKQELIKILKKNVPNVKWKTKKEAINAIEGEVYLVIQTENDEIIKYNQLITRKSQKKKILHIEIDSLNKTIEKWSREDEHVRAAFDSVVQRMYLGKRRKMEIGKNI